jgi:carbon-monoxide dehydrogenase medium subunit
VKAAPFRYAKPTSVEEAIALKADHGEAAQFLAGGQSLLPVLAMRLNRPELLIDINGLAELDGISQDGDTIRIGALTRTKAIGRSELLARHVPLLGLCVEHIAHPAIRTLSTFGGSVALADPAAEWPACCLALDATIVVRGRAGERAIPSREFFTGLYATARAPDELLVRVDIPVQPPDARPVALELCRRRGDYAIVGVLAQGRAAGPDALGDPRIVFFGVADRPVRLPEIEAPLRGRASLEGAIAALEAGLDPEGDLYHGPATKKHLAKALLTRAVRQMLH